MDSSRLNQMRFIACLLEAANGFAFQQSAKPRSKPFPCVDCTSVDMSVLEVREMP